MNGSIIRSRIGPGIEADYLRGGAAIHELVCLILHQAALIGLLVLATQATRPGLLRYAGYEADDLAALLKYRLMSAIDFLIAQQAMPTRVDLPVSSHAAPMVSAAAADLSTTVTLDAAEGLDDLGAHFMDA